MSVRARKLNFARLNHILIPTTAADRDRWRASRTGRLFRPLGRFYEALTLEGQVALTLSMFLGALSLDVGGVDCHLLWAPLTALQVLSLVAARWYGVAGASLDVALPQRVIAGEEVHFSVTLHNRSGQSLYALRVDGPFLPWDGAWTREPPVIARLPPGAQETVTCHARFRSRGEHHLDTFRVSALVPFGLCEGPSVYSSGCRFVVVPPVARIATLRTSTLARHQPGGVPRVTSTGESFDLRGVRPYRPGDPIRDLHARSWARTGFPVVREYQQEYFRRVAIVVDPDTSGAAHPAVLDALISLAAGLAATLGRDDTLVDLVIVGRRLHELNAHGGAGADLLGPTLDVLACVDPGPPLDPAPCASAVTCAMASSCGEAGDVGVIEASAHRDRRSGRVRQAGEADEGAALLV